MSGAASSDRSGRFLEEAVLRGFVTASQADDCRRIGAALAEVGEDLPPDEIAVRKGYMTREKADALKRALARLRVGRYEVLERLGEGAAGVVWKARDTVLDRVVALKLLSADARSLGTWRESFLREARVAVTLNHERVVRGLDCGEADGYLFFAMEFVPGGSLAERIAKEGRLSEATALRAALDVSEALRYIHGFGLIHRDIKPENLLVGDDARIKLCDLGLAKPLREQAEQRDTAGLAAGTPLYMSPEQIRDGDRVDWRSDVYALGATLFHLLCGRPPFPAERGRDVLARHLNEAAPSPREFALDVTPEAAAVVLKMLQKAPQDRYRSLDDLDEDLRSALAGRPPIHTVTFAPKERITLDGAAVVPRRRSLVPALTIAGIALAATGVLGYVVFHRLQTLERPAGDAEQRPVRPDPQAPGAQHPAEPTTGAPRHPATPQDPREEEARRALEVVERRAAANPADPFGARAELLFLVDRWSGTQAARIAQERADRLTAEIERLADADLGRRLLRVAAEQADGRHGRAIAELDAMPAEFAVTEAGRRADEKRRQVREEGLRYVDELLGDAFALARDAKFGDAEARIERAGAVEILERQADIREAREGIAEAKARWSEQRTAQARRFDEVFSTAVLMLASPGGVDAATAWLDTARADVSAWHSELAVLRADLTAAAATNPAAMPSTRATTEELRAALLARLSRGRIAEAQTLLARIDVAAPEAADDAREAVRRVRSLLEGQAADLVAAAEQHRAAKRFDDARDYVERALRKVPGHPLARAVGAAIQMDRGRLDAAIAELESVVAAGSPPPEAHLYLGEALQRRRRDDDRAEREFRQFLLGAARDDPRRAVVQANLDEIGARQRESALHEARSKLRRAQMRRDAEAVLVAADEILHLIPDDADALLAAGSAHLDAGRVRDGWRLLRRIADARPGSAQAATAEALLDDLERRAAATPVVREEARSARADLDAGKIDRAIAAFDRVLGVAPFLEEALLGAGEARLLRRGPGAAEDLRDALEILGDLVLRNPNHARGLTLHAEALLRSGEHRAALEEAQRAMDLDRARPDPASVAGDALLALKDPQRALELYSASLDRRRTIRASLGSALAWEALGSRQNAKREVERLLAEFPVPEDMAEAVDALAGRFGLERAPEEPTSPTSPPAGTAPGGGDTRTR